MRSINFVNQTSEGDANDIMYNSLDDLKGDELYQFYNENAIDVPDEFKKSSYLVFNMNDANKKLKRRICTPTRSLHKQLPAINERKFSFDLEQDKIFEESKIVSIFPAF